MVRGVALGMERRFDDSLAAIETQPSSPWPRPNDLTRARTPPELNPETVELGISYHTRTPSRAAGHGVCLLHHLLQRLSSADDDDGGRPDQLRCPPSARRGR